MQFIVMMLLNHVISKLANTSVQRSFSANIRPC